MSCLYSAEITWNVAGSGVVFVKRALCMALGQGFTVYVTQAGYLIVFFLPLKTGTWVRSYMLHELQLVVPFGASCIDSVMAVLILVIRFPKIILQFCLLYWGYIWKWNGGKTRKRHRVCPVVEIFGVLTTRVLYPVPDQLKKPINDGDIAPWPIWNNLSIWLVALWI